MPLRVFVAIPLPPDVKTTLSALQTTFKSLPLEATWVRLPGFHITLKFLGEVESVQIGHIVSAMQEATRGCQPFSLRLCGLGVFPNELSPRVLWLGIEGDVQRLTSLQGDIESRLARIGFPSDERPYTPHLTLARLKRISRRSDFIAHLNTHRRAIVGEIEVHQLELLESQLHPSGARYSTVRTVTLQGATDTSMVRRGSEMTVSFGNEKIGT
jgi:RNA 2',3'-cyclic 3'-phosphodiesterase